MHLCMSHTHTHAALCDCLVVCQDARSLWLHSRQQKKSRQRRRRRRARSRRQHLSNFQSGLQTMQQQQLQQQLVAKNIGSRGGITNYCCTYWDTPLKCFPAASLQRVVRLVYTHHDALLMPCELQNTNRFKPRSSRAGVRCCWHCSSMSSEGRFISHLWWSSPENANKTGIMYMM